MYTRILLEKSRSALVVFFVVATGHSGEKFSGCISSETVTALFWPQSFPIFIPNPWISRRMQSYSSFSARGRYRESVSISKYFEIVHVTKFGKKLWYSSSIRGFAYWRLKNPTMIDSLCSICALASSTSYNELFTWSSFLKSLLLIAACLLLLLGKFVTGCWLRSIFC